MLAEYSCALASVLRLDRRRWSADAVARAAPQLTSRCSSARDTSAYSRRADIEPESQLNCKSTARAGAAIRASVTVTVTFAPGDPGRHAPGSDSRHATSTQRVA